MALIQTLNGSVPQQIINAYQDNYQYRPAVVVTFDLYGNSSPLWNVDQFQYVMTSARATYAPDDSTYLDTWSLTGAFQSNYYVTLIRNAPNDFTVNVHHDSTNPVLVCTGSGTLSSTITLTERNNSGITGSVNKNATDLSSPYDPVHIVMTDATAWQTATKVGTTSFTGLQASTSGDGRSFIFYWDINTDLPATVNDTYQFRVHVSPQSTVEVTLTKGKTGISVMKQVVDFSLGVANFTNLLTYFFYINSIVGTSVTKYRVAESEATLSTSTWSTILEVSEGSPPVVYTKGQLTFSNGSFGVKNIYVEIADTLFNRSPVYSDSIVYNTTQPLDSYVKVTGSNGSEYYTGFTTDSNGRFNTTNLINLNIYARPVDPTMTLQYSLDGDLKPAYNVTPNYVTFDPANPNITARLTGNLLGDDLDKTVTVYFRDEAGNVKTLSKNIRFNTKLYRMGYPLVNSIPVTNSYLRNLREPSSDYDLQITESTTSGTNLVIPKSVVFAGQYVRKWEDVFYPITHRYPVLADGTIDTTVAIAMGGSSNAQYDAVQLSGGAIVYDTQGRVTTVDWTKNGTKNYENFESSPTSGLKYWVIDNYGYGAIDLTFEHFYIDSNKYGPPYNKQSPYGGDCVVIYDASATGCVTSQTVAGKEVFTLADSSLLVELQAYTGVGSSAYSLKTGASVNANTNGGFNVPTITTTSRICVILYSDASVTSYGFKIKAGPQYAQTWINYDVDYENAELWLHKYPTGTSTANKVKALVDYYSSKITKDYDDGSIVLEVQPEGEITADYSYYNYAGSDLTQSRLFATYNDDFVDYLDANAYVCPSGVIPNKNIIYTYDLETYTVVVPSGKIVQLYTWDKDRGILEFTDASASGVIPGGIIPSGIPSGELQYAFVPRGRMFADYDYHTYYRLSNDGYGNFVFYDETLVADSTPQYPDYTYGDIKIINEGGVILEDGLMRFLARGFDSNGDGTVDQVIDINRPWDVQQGTAAETYQKSAAEIRTQYTWATTCSKQDAMNILGSWQGRGFPANLYPQQVMYGRVVWVLGGSGGSSYPTTTSGKKAWSSEVSGKFYLFQS